MSEESKKPIVTPNETPNEESKTQFYMDLFLDAKEKYQKIKNSKSSDSTDENKLDENKPKV